MRKVSRLLFVFTCLSLVLAACAGPAATQPAAQPPAATEAPVETQAPAPTDTAAPPASAETKLILATTTSTEDSGLLEYLLPDFEQQFGVAIDVIAVGTGQAITLGQDGNADVLLVHARAREDEFMTAGHGVRREDVMYNDFVILGPAADPAGVAGLTAAEALQKLAETQNSFISRGDDSGTHTKELSIWKKAGIEPAGDWYISAGQGMGEVITMANEQQAYTLSDRATYLARSLQGLELKVLVEGDASLFNPYGVIAVNPAKNDKIQVDLANQFIDWLISVPVQEKIAAFGMDEFGQSLFVPDSQLWREAKGGANQESPTQAAPAAFAITGLVDKEQAWSESEIRALPTTKAEGKSNKGEADSYTGVLISDLLLLAGPKAEAATLVFIGDDGSTVEAALADVQACTNCIVSFRNNGGFSLLLPFLSEQLSLRGVLEIQVK